ncbi:MAG: CheA signal transduction histidine kinase [Planctomycetaceae bacterium]|nr:CheA signal transduction histidine kinase [Planctomycetaceae bacterium]
MDQSLLQEFVLESTHSLEKVEQDLLALERTFDAAAINRMFRALHSIKGSSSYLGLHTIERLSHQAETLLDLLRQRLRELTPATVDVLLQCVDQLRQMLQLPDHGASVDINPTVTRLFEFIREPGVEAPTDEASDADFTLSEPLPAPVERATVDRSTVELERPLSNSSVAPAIPPGSGETPLGRTFILEHDNDQHDRNGGRLLVAATAPPVAMAPAVQSLSGSHGGFATAPAAQAAVRTEAIPHARNGSLTPAGGNGSPSAPPPAALSDSRGDDHPAEEKMMRVRVKFLDDLLQLTGNMVMARNQLLSKYNFADDPAFGTLSQCVTQVHKTIVQTRMQPIGTLFDRCERLTRDLARQLGKEVSLEVHGRELELDRSVLEAFSDPLTHLLRNALDHGLETPQERQAAGKTRVGHLKLAARQQGAEIILSLEDDGRGIDPDRIKHRAIERGLITADQAETLHRRALLDFIFRSGFSTRDEVTSLSGRGVGLDVVRTNLESLGGVVEVQSTVGKGSAFVARLPLTQALVSSSLISALIVKCEEERYAIPQTAVDEIIKVDPRSDRDRIRRLNGRMVYQLRDTVLPVVSLRSVLGGGDNTPEEEHVGERILVVIQFRQQLFGMLVDLIVGVDEIVVRPLPRMVKNCGIFSGHTVMGDGQIALILDSGGIVDREQLTFADDTLGTSLLHGEREHVEGDQRLVVFSYADTEHFAIPLEMVSLIERVELDDIRRVGAQEYVQVMQRTLPLLRLDRVMGVGGLPKLAESYVLVPARVSYPIAVLTGRRVAVVDAVEQFESRLSDGQGMLGTFMHDNKLVMLLDLYRLFERHSPDRFRLSPVEQRPAQILLAEDSPFFQNLIRSYLEHPPRRLTVVSDGEEALDLLREHPEDFDVLVSDIEMPRMDGFELVRQIRADAALRTLPVIAVTSLATPEHIERGLREGFDSYLIKIDKEQLVSTIDRYLERGARHRAAFTSARKGST